MSIWAHPFPSAECLGWGLLWALGCSTLVNQDAAAAFTFLVPYFLFFSKSAKLYKTKKTLPILILDELFKRVCLLM